MLQLSRAARQCLESCSSREPSAQLKISASNTRNKACHKAPAKVITMSVSGGNSKEIFELFTNKLCFLCQCRKDEESDDDPDSHLLIRLAFREKCIFTDYNERVFVFDLIYFVK